jgi:hypothetical protein
MTYTINACILTLKEPSENYVMTVLPEAFTDFLKKNDT